jgi:HD-GYP domain-containing protein (c-di-GMP phosphodiesterase class II)
VEDSDTEEAVQELAAFAGTKFDPVLAGVFIDAAKECTALELSDQTVAAAKSKIGADFEAGISAVKSPCPS